MSEIDLVNIKKRVAMRRAEGQQTISISCSGLLELVARLEKAEFCSRPTVEVTPITDDMIAAAAFELAEGAVMDAFAGKE